MAASGFRKRFLYPGALALTATISYYNWQHIATIQVAMHNYPPYESIDVNGYLIGDTVDVIRCVMDKMGRSYKFTQYQTWDVMLDKIRHHDADLAFGGIRSEDRDQIATFSRPIGTLRVYRVRRNDNNRFLMDKGKIIYGGKTSSAITKEMEFMGVTINQKFETDEAVMKAIHDYDIDYTYMDEKVFQYYVKLLNYNPNDFTLDYIITQKYGAYVSKHLISNDPLFLPKFNARIEECYKDEE